MGFIDYYVKAWQNFSNFSGRARRKEFWYVFIVNLAISFVLGFIDGIIFGDSGLGLLGALYSLAFLIPGIALSIRRLHDTGRSGWWCLIGFIPIIGAIVLIVFFASDSEPGKNQYDAA